jgi:hypothetical protein
MKLSVCLIFTLTIFHSIEAFNPFSSEPDGDEQLHDFMVEEKESIADKVEDIYLEDEVSESAVEEVPDEEHASSDKGTVIEENFDEDEDLDSDEEPEDGFGGDEFYLRHS